MAGVMQPEKGTPDVHSVTAYGTDILGTTYRYVVLDAMRPNQFMELEQSFSRIVTDEVEEGAILVDGVPEVWKYFSGTWSSEVFFSPGSSPRKVGTYLSVPRRSAQFDVQHDMKSFVSKIEDQSNESGSDSGNSGATDSLCLDDDCDTLLEHEVAEEYETAESKPVFSKSVAFKLPATEVDDETAMKKRPTLSVAIGPRGDDDGKHPLASSRTAMIHYADSARRIVHELLAERLKDLKGLKVLEKNGKGPFSRVSRMWVSAVTVGLMLILR